MKKTIIYIIFILTIIVIVFRTIVPIVLNIFNDDLDMCLDNGICREGLVINTEYGKIKVEQETCLKHHWRWIEDSNSCIIK